MHLNSPLLLPPWKIFLSLPQRTEGRRGEHGGRTTYFTKGHCDACVNRYLVGRFDSERTKLRLPGGKKKIKSD